MSKVVWISLLGMLMAFGARATHIVGGEIELEYRYDNFYQLRLIQYFDNFYGNPGAEDAQVIVYIFSKSNSQLLGTYTLNQVEDSFVPYTNLQCSIAQLSTRKLVYQSTVLLDPTVFDEPDGYYAVWERCCRNRVITNIIRPEETGQTFILEFPPVVKNGEQFINSTPQLFPPLADYACVNRPFYFDFGGTDPDGDSLVYSLEAPLNSSEVAIPLPTPTPPPHRTVNFIAGLSGTNPIPSNFGEGMRITRDGFLTVTPNQAGLFVFSVKVEEYRDGERIGEVRRDFQMLVADDCEQATAPIITADLPNGDSYVEGDTLFLGVTDPRCFSVYVTDEDATDFESEAITLRAVPVNFIPEGGLNDILGTSSGFLSGSSSTLESEVCLPECPYIDDGAYIIDFIAYDDACAKPLTDTIRMYFVVEAPPNEEPIASTNAPEDTLFVEFGTTLSFDVFGDDADGDSVDLFILDPPFDFEVVGMQFDDATGVGNVNSGYTWVLDCDVLRLGYQDVYPLSFVVEDRDYCRLPTSDTVTRVVKVIPPVNQPPTVNASIVDASAVLEDTLWIVTFNDLLRIRAQAQDPEGNNISLRLANQQDSLLQLYSMFFNEVTGSGTVQGDLEWTAYCDYLNPGETELGPFTLEFVAEDEFCIFPKQDTIVMHVLARDPGNNAGEFIVPNIFTPNGDGFNEAFEIPDLPTDNCFGQFEELVIVNRWGDRVFETNQLDFRWNGTGEPDGIYYWAATYTSGVIYKGWVTLYR